MRALVAISLLALSLTANAQRDSTKVFLPKGRFFEIPYLDPNEALAYGCFAAWWDNGELLQKAYLPVSFGFYKPIVRYNKKRKVEFGIDAAAHFQFEWLISDSIVQRNLLNTDYKFSFNLAFQLSQKDFLRFRLYHVSSHFGDDYLLRNRIRNYFPNPNNYEQLDVLWARQSHYFWKFVGLGLVVRPETIRKRLSGSFGTTFDIPMRTQKPRGWAGGLHARLLQENDFRPGVKLAMGVRVGKVEDSPFRFLIEFYNGNLPFSPLEYKKITWLGMGLYFSPG